MDTLINLAGKVKWVWVDCFTKLPIIKETYKLLKDCGFKLCLVSPELQGQDEKLEQYKDYLNCYDIKFDAICAKFQNIDRWVQ